MELSRWEKETLQNLKKEEVIDSHSNPYRNILVILLIVGFFMIIQRNEKDSFQHNLSLLIICLPFFFFDWVSIRPKLILKKIVGPDDGKLEFRNSSEIYSKLSQKQRAYIDSLHNIYFYNIALAYYERAAMFCTKYLSLPLRIAGSVLVLLCLISIYTRTPAGLGKNIFPAVALIFIGLIPTLSFIKKRKIIKYRLHIILPALIFLFIFCVLIVTISLNFFDFTLGTFLRYVIWSSILLVIAFRNCIEIMRYKLLLLKIFVK